MLALQAGYKISRNMPLWSILKALIVKGNITLSLRYSYGCHLQLKLKGFRKKPVSTVASFGLARKLKEGIVQWRSAQRWLLIAVACGCICAAQVRAESAARFENAIAREVRHELLTLPFYTVFDDLTFREDRGMVTLMGQVTRPILRHDAEAAVQRIEGVKRVDNQIEVLPLSASDDRMRLEEYAAIYGDAELNHYAVRSVPPIHIIVKNGNVTLEGTIDSADDKALAFSSVRGVVSVTDHLRVSH